MAEYRKYLEAKNCDELRVELKSRSLPHVGNKAELVDRMLGYKRKQIEDEFTVAQLKVLLRGKELPLKGNKADLVDRLLDTLIPEPSSSSVERNCAGQSRPSPVAARPTSAAAGSIGTVAVRPVVVAARNAARVDPVARVLTVASQPPAVVNKQEAAKARAAAGCMSRQQYRRQLEAAGFEIESDQDVFHIIASVNGGADHPHNYHFVQNKSWNRAIGANHDELNCYHAGKEKAEKAVAISRLLGNTEGKKYTGPSAAELFHAGEAAMRDVRTGERARKKSS